MVTIVSKLKSYTSFQVFQNINYQFTINYFKNKNILKKSVFLYKIVKAQTMFQRFTITDKLLFLAAILSLIFSEILYFQGEKEDASFIGLWVPSILAFGIYLKLINNTKND